MSRMIKGMLVKIWSDENIEDIPATLNEKTGEIFTKPNEVDNDFNLDNDVYIDEIYFESDEGCLRYEVCKICQEYIKKPTIIETESHQLNQVNICVNGCNEI